MKKLDMVRMVSQRTNIAQKYVKAIINAYIDCTLETLAENRDEHVHFGTLGYFYVKHVAERSGYTKYGKDGEWYMPAYDRIGFNVNHKSRKLLIDDNLKDYKAGGHTKELFEAMEEEE